MELWSKISTKSTFKAKLTAPPPQLEYLRLHKYLAFCGIGNPTKFFKTLEENHIPVLETKAFPDHYDYKGVEVVNLLETARALGAKLITTKKDWVRLPVNLRDEIDVLEVEMEFEDEHELASLLKKIERA